MGLLSAQKHNQLLRMYTYADVCQMHELTCYWMCEGTLPSLKGLNFEPWKICVLAIMNRVVGLGETKEETHHWRGCLAQRSLTKVGFLDQHYQLYPVTCS